MTWKNESTRHSLASRGFKTPSTKTRISLPDTEYKSIGNEHGHTHSIHSGRNKVGMVNVMNYPHGREDIFEPHLYVGFIDVDERFQNQGVGSDLLQKAIDEQESKNLPLYLEANPPDKWTYINENNLDEWINKRDSLIRFYERHGFEIHDEENDMITMVKR